MAQFKSCQYHSSFQILQFQTTQIYQVSLSARNLELR